MASLMMRAGQSLVAAPKAHRSTVVCAASRPLWLPGKEAPAHLDGSLPGDYGFDPLGLGTDPEALKWYVQSELVHGRTAMTAVAGILIPSALTKAGALSVPEWFDAGKVYNDSGDAIPFTTLLAVELILCGFVEVKRWQDFAKPGSQGESGSFVGFETAFTGTGVNGYPGGLFDPLGFAGKPNYDEFKVKEVKNGRLAMLAFIGFAAAYEATGKGPLDALSAHLADPLHTTFADNGVSVPYPF